MKKLLTTLWLCIGVTIATTASATFTNAGFETGDFTGWTVGGPNTGSGVDTDGTLIPGTDAFFDPNRVSVRSGTYAAFGIVANTIGEYLSLSQLVNVAAGIQEVGFFMSVDAGNQIGINNAIDDKNLAIFVDGVHLPFSERFPTNNFPIDGEFHEFSSIFNSTGGTSLVELRIGGSGTGRVGISIDDTWITGASGLPVSDSGQTLLLLGLGISTIAVFRRAR